MPRPCKRRAIGGQPPVDFYKPMGVPLRHLETVSLSLDEFEALRLCYQEGLYQEQAARMMEVSRQTIGRILNVALAKIADALLGGKALKIEGGNVITRRKFACPECAHVRELPFGSGRRVECPNCGSSQSFRADDQRGRHGNGRCRRRNSRRSNRQGVER